VVSVSGFVAHGDSYCPVVTRDGELPVDRIDTGPLPQPGKPIIGICRNCGRLGAAYEPRPTDPAQDEQADAFTRWLTQVVDQDVEVHEPHATLHKQLLTLHAPTGVVVLEGRPGAAPVTAQQCRECGGDRWPCTTLRLLAEWHRHDLPGWSEKWLT
jgi:hypothetical protein